MTEFIWGHLAYKFLLLKLSIASHLQILDHMLQQLGSTDIEINFTHKLDFNYNLIPHTRIRCNTFLKLIPKLILNILLLLYLMIAFSNCSIYNPGPTIQPGINVVSSGNTTHSDKLSVYYQNVQGLIPFTELNKTHPNLDNTKLFELHAYIYDKYPDIVVLNETWLKSSILDSEILPPNLYKIFRWNGKHLSHPPDPDNPLKYKRNGGGVLIVVSCSLQLSSCRVYLNCEAELLAVEVVMNDNSKLVITTCYRVGTLGIKNCREICNAITKLLRKKRVKKLFIIGDFNLRNVNWETNSSTNNVEQLFLEESFKLGLIQCITAPTHTKGNILDILLTNSESLLSNVHILSNCEICKSDHYTITFDLKLKIVRKKPVKIQRFNFKKANWDNLNTELNNVNWISVLDCLEPDIAWLRFKDILNSLLHIYIPIVTVRLNSQPPWFDTECYLKCKEKERLHKRYKSIKSIQDELKFSLYRKEFKSLLKSKMRDNLYCSNDRSVICKQFWLHVKMKSRSNRIPEVMKHESSISSQSTTKANMFNDYFHKQFSHSSTYVQNSENNNCERHEVND